MPQDQPRRPDPAAPDPQVVLHDLIELLTGLDPPPRALIGPVQGVRVSGLSWDSTSTSPGDLYFCLEGTHRDGHDFAAQALGAGAAALVVARPLDLRPGTAPVPATQVPTTQVVVEDSRLAMAQVAAVHYGHPSRTMSVVGVTGTNGKTTVTHLLASILAAAGRPSGVIGTLSQVLTTPEAPELTAQLAALAAQGVNDVAIEVSSHALVQHRVAATHFAAAVFTNLSHDHLDYHGTLEEYFRAKASLFDPRLVGTGVVGTDTAWGQRLATEAAEAGVDVVRFCLADAQDLELVDGAWRWRWRGRQVRLGLPGRHNVLNALAAATTAEVIGVDPAAVAQGLADAPVVPGRFELVDAGQPFTVVVDFAHTPDALAHALESARDLAGEARITVVFGCGGERDAAKRGPMGRVAATGADRVVVTSDNPRGEDPQVIAAQVVAGTSGAGHVTVDLDRASAIGAALAAARPGDVVLVAGKGHETHQTDASGRHPFDDRQVIADILAHMGFGGAGRSGP